MQDELLDEQANQECFSRLVAKFPDTFDYDASPPSLLHSFQLKQSPKHQFTMP